MSGMPKPALTIGRKLITMNGGCGRSRDEHDRRGKVRYLSEEAVRMSA